MSEPLLAGERFRIGYALAPRSVSSFIQNSLLVHAKQRGIDLIPIDLDKPLVEQGPFDAVFHKLYDAEWKKQLEEFSLENPTAIIVDPIESIEKLHNRVSMLDAVSQLKIENLESPLQAFVDSNESLQDAIGNQGMKFPLIAKALMANSTADAHQMHLVLNEQGLNGIKTPIVLQEFVNHGGVIFKVYVAGDHVRCVKRKSLPDITEEKLGNISENLIPFSLISYFADNEESDESYAKLMEAAVVPPSSFIEEVSKQLRHALKLHLFNFDMIRDGNRYLIIDINYFPGYAKVPEYELMLTPFFLDIAHQKHSKENGNFDQVENNKAECNGHKE